MKLIKCIFVFCVLLYSSKTFAANILLIIDYDPTVDRWEWINRINYLAKKDTNEIYTKRQMQQVFYTTLQAQLIAQGHTVTVVSLTALQGQTTAESILLKSKFYPKPKYKNGWDKLTSIPPKYTSLNFSLPELQPYLTAQLMKYDYIISLNRVSFSHNFWKAFFNRGKRQINMHYNIIDQDKKMRVGKVCQMHLILKKSALPNAITIMMNAPAKHLAIAFQPFIEKK